MISKSSLDKTVLDMISDSAGLQQTHTHTHTHTHAHTHHFASCYAAGTAEDKMRLFIIYYILSTDMSEVS